MSATHKLSPKHTHIKLCPRSRVRPVATSPFPACDHHEGASVKSASPEITAPDVRHHGRWQMLVDGKAGGENAVRQNGDKGMDFQSESKRHLGLLEIHSGCHGCGPSPFGRRNLALVSRYQACNRARMVLTRAGCCAARSFRSPMSSFKL